MPSMPSTVLTGETPLQHRIEFRQLAELELLDHVAREIARQDELHLARHRLLVDGVAIDQVLLGFRAQEDVLAAFRSRTRASDWYLGVMSWTATKA